MQQQMKALNRILNSLQNAEEDLAKGQRLTKAEVQCLLQLTAEQAVAGLRKQVAAWEAILAGEQPEPVVRLHMLVPASRTGCPSAAPAGSNGHGCMRCCRHRGQWPPRRPCQTRRAGARRA